MEITIEEMEKKFEELPEDLKWAIMESDVDEKVTQIGKDHGLNVEELGQLSLEVHAVMLGYTLPDKFEESIKASLGFPDLKTKEIAEEVNDRILKDIREKLMAQRRKEEENAEKTQIPIEEEVKEQENITSEPVENKKKEEEIKKEIQNKKIMESISSKKLFGSFQSPTVKTEYTLNNLTKDKEKGGTSVKQNDKIPLEATLRPASSGTKDLSPSYSIKEDPYRMKPE